MAENWKLAESAGTVGTTDNTISSRRILKTKCNEIYCRIQPIPYIKEKVFSTDVDLLVELGDNTTEGQNDRNRITRTPKKRRLGKQEEKGAQLKTQQVYSKSIEILQAAVEYVEGTVNFRGEQNLNKIDQLLQNSPLLNEICRIPLFCVMFAYITESAGTENSFSSVTGFFSDVLKRFYAHMWTKGRRRKSSEPLIVPNYSGLNKFSYDCLIEENGRLVWQRNYFKSKVGDECYRELVSLGILLEDDTSRKLKRTVFGKKWFSKTKTYVSFYHDIFIEWYAANYLSECAGKVLNFSLSNKLKNIDPFKYQYFYRFASGLSETAFSKIVKVLTREPQDGTAFSALCQLEHKDNSEFLNEHIRSFCSSGTSIYSTDSGLQHRSTFQLMQIASISKVPVSRVIIELSIFTMMSSEVCLNTGIDIPRKLLVDQVLVTGDSKYVAQDTIVRITQSVYKWEGLNELRFKDSFMPLYINHQMVPDHIKSWRVPVTWNPFNVTFRMNFHSGQWEVKEMATLRELCSDGVHLTDAMGAFQQRSILQLLKIAANSNIPVPYFAIQLSNCTFDKDTLRLKSGLNVPRFSTIQGILITEEEDVGEEQFVGILRYGRKCNGLKEIRFEKCKVPKSININLISSSLKAWSVEVYWKPHDCDFRLSFESGRWTVDDVESIRRMCAEIFRIGSNCGRLQHMSQSTILDIATTNDIPISCLSLSAEHIDSTDGKVKLESGINLESYPTLVTLRIQADSNELTAEEVIGLCSYAQTCGKLEELRYCSILALECYLSYLPENRFEDCFLPSFFNESSIAPGLKKWKVPVTWTACEYEFRLLMVSGQWEFEDLASLQQLCLDTFDVTRTEDRMHQRAILQLLHIAVNHDITISCLHLCQSFCTVTESYDVVLYSKLLLSCPSTVEMIGINTDEEGKEFSEEEFVAILLFAQKSRKLTELWFGDCLLPQYIPPQSIPIKIQLRRVEGNMNFITVSWNPHDSFQRYVLDFQSGRWINCSTMRQIEDVEYMAEVTRFRAYWRDTEFQKRRAASTNILRNTHDVIKAAITTKLQ